MRETQRQSKKGETNLLSVKFSGSEKKMPIQGGEKPSKTKSGTERDEDSSGNEGFWEGEKSCGQI